MQHFGAVLSRNIHGGKASGLMKSDLRQVPAADHAGLMPAEEYFKAMGARVEGHTVNGHFTG